MRAGLLDREVRLQRRTVDASGPYGAVSSSWSDLGIYRAQLVEARASEFMRDYGQTTETVRIFRTRYVADVTTDDRVLYESAPHDIVEIAEIGRKRGLEIRCVRRADHAG